MKYLFLSVATTTEFSDIVASTLFEFGCSGVSIKDANDLAELIKSKKHWDYIDDSAFIRDAVVTVTGFFDESADLHEIERAIAALKNDPGFETGSLETTSGIEDSEQWENVWKQYYRPLKFSRVTVVPIWLKDEPPAQGDGIASESKGPCVYIDPGLAFGTGLHESTSMCIELLEELGFTGKAVIDVGCGTGILGAAALKLGAAHCDFIDIDENAVKASKQNAAHNHIIDRADFITGGFSVLSSKDRTTEAAPEVILANLTADLLIALYPFADVLLASGGTMVVSGILDEYAPAVIETFEKTFFVKKIKNRNGWQAMLLQKR